MLERIEFDRIVFGGSFDPPHLGHAAMARFALEKTRCLSIVPAALSPLKGSTQATFVDRMRMVELMARRLRSETGSGRIEVLDLEGKRPAPSYTFETLRHLRSHHPDESIGLLLGSDSLADFEKWKSFEEIFEHHPIVLFARSVNTQRDVMDLEGWRSRGARIQLESREIPGCASREIRAQIARAQWEVLRECLDTDVLEFIEVRGIYSNV